MFDNATKSYEIPLICPSEQDVTVTSHAILIDVVGKLMVVSVRTGDVFESGKEYLHGCWSYGMYTEAETELPFGDDMKTLINNKIAHLIHNNFNPDVLEKMTTLMIMKKTSLVHDLYSSTGWSKKDSFLIICDDAIYLKSPDGMFVGMFSKNHFSKLISDDQLLEMDMIYLGNHFNTLQQMKNPFDIRVLSASGFFESRTYPRII